MHISALNNPYLFGHTSAKKYFLKSFRAGKLPHSLLISGAQGIGKATLAYHFAKFLLQHPLHQPQDLEIVSKNATITKIEALSHPDFLLIDAQSICNEPRKQPTISVDEIREVSKFLHLTPSESDYLVVIIDGAEYMNQNAANALLKILEEPPSNAFIFLVSESPFKLLPTLRSRCVNLKLLPLNIEVFSQALLVMIPEYNQTHIEALYRFTEGNLKLASMIYSKYGENFLDTNFNSIDHLVKLADNTKNHHEDWYLLRYIMLTSITQDIKSCIGNNSKQEDRVDRFFNLQNKLIEAESLHLDKQHFILSLL